MKLTTTAVMNTAGTVAIQCAFPILARYAARSRARRRPGVWFAQPKYRQISPKSDREMRNPMAKRGTAMTSRFPCSLWEKSSMSATISGRCGTPYRRR